MSQNLPMKSLSGFKMQSYNEESDGIGFIKKLG